MLLKLSHTLFFILLTSIVIQANTANCTGNEQYVERFKKIAVIEMHRSGIPASIKLAQAILESGSGQSTLAKKANNHFGIKCGGSWKGKTYHKKDDERRMGIRVKSCFRAYASPEESFTAHTKFLTNPSKKSRYGFLFKYKKTDYKKWAKGLKKAGYATNPKYPALLIQVIKENDLHKYDMYSLEDVNAKEEDKEILAYAKNKKKEKAKVQKNEGKLEAVSPNKNTKFSSKRKKDKQKKTAPAKTKKVKVKESKSNKADHIFYRNDIKVIKIQKGDTPQKIAKRHKIKKSKLLKYNDLSGMEPLKENAYFYLQPKRNSSRGRDNFHIVKGNESMYDIAQQYGIKLEKLYKKNKMIAGQEPNEDERIILRNKRSKPPKLRKKATIKKTATQPEKNTRFVPKPKKATQKKKANPNEYIVKKGETLYRIAKAHKVSVEDIRKWNKLKNNDLEVGQTLIIKK